MNHNLIDFKVTSLMSFFTAVSFSNAEIGMKIIVFVLTVGYTIDRWIYLRKNKKDKE